MSKRDREVVEAYRLIFNHYNLPETMPLVEVEGEWYLLERKGSVPSVSSTLSMADHMTSPETLKKHGWTVTPVIIHRADRKVPL